MIKGIRPSLAQAGAIKIGKLSDTERKTKSGRVWYPPEKLSYFLIAKNTRDSRGHLELDEEMLEVLRRDWGDSDGQCRAIPILLHSDDIDEVFPTVYAAYASKQVVCRGDGEKATRWEYKDKRRTGHKFGMSCPCRWLDEGKCKPHGTLHCTIALPGHAVAGAVYRWRTTGIISIQRMIGSLDQIRAAVGTIVGVPLVLRVQPVQVSPDGRSQTVYSCHVELRAADLLEVQQRALEAKKTREQLGPPVRALIQAPASDDEPPEEQAAVEAEFFPPSESGELPREDVVAAVKAAAQRTAGDAEPPPQDDGDVPDYGAPDGEVAF